MHAHRLREPPQKGEQYILLTGREWQFGWFTQDTWQVSKDDNRRELYQGLLRYWQR